MEKIDTAGTVELLGTTYQSNLVIAFCIVVLVLLWYIVLFLEWRRAAKMKDMEIKTLQSLYYKIGLKDKVETKKIVFADAIITEAKFNGIDLDIMEDLEHQLGTVWLGNKAFTQTQPVDFEEED